MIQGSLLRRGLILSSNKVLLEDLRFFRNSKRHAVSKMRIDSWGIVVVIVGNIKINTEEILKYYHDSSAAGHFNVNKTLMKVPSFIAPFATKI